VNVNLDEYNKVLKAVEEKLAVQQGISRGWFTYTELETLSATFLAWNSVTKILYDYAIQVKSETTICERAQRFAYITALLADKNGLRSKNAILLTLCTSNHSS